MSETHRLSRNLKANRRNQSRHLARRRLLMESLEDRRLLAAAPTITINDVQQLEGDSGTTSDFVFTVARSGKVNQPSTITYFTAPGSATEGADYQATSGTLNFGSGERTKTITVPVIGDGNVEDDETFSVDLTDVDNSQVVAQGVGTI